MYVLLCLFYNTNDTLAVASHEKKMLSSIIKNAARNLSTKARILKSSSGYQVEALNNYFSINDTKISFAWLRDHCRYILNNLIGRFPIEIKTKIRFHLMQSSYYLQWGCKSLSPLPRYEAKLP